MKPLETIVILAEALAKADLSDISELNITYFVKGDTYRGTLTLADQSKFYIYDSGAIRILTEDEE